MTWKHQNKLLWVVPVLLLLCSLGSCVKDNCSRTYTTYIPVYKTLTDVRKGMKSSVSKELKNPGKLYIYGQYIFLNEQEKGIHIIDNSNPAAPKNISFIEIPGNVDLAVRGNTLYADAWSDLVAFDITDPKAVVAKKFVNNAFPHRNRYYRSATATTNSDSILVVTDWIAKDTTVDCKTYNYLRTTFYESALADASGKYASPNMGGGAGGSMARFTLVNNYLYTVTDNMLNTFDISTPQEPSFTGKVNLNNWGIETIFPFRDKLFIGSTTGMFIYDVSSPATPAKLGSFSHVRSCDPVIADDKYAFVTLRSGTACQGFSNQLEVLDISDLSNPKLLVTKTMNNPHGLAKDGDLLFICDGKAGLTIWNAADVKNIKPVNDFRGIETYDVIAYDKRALVVAKDGLYQYSYADPANITLLSKIAITKE